MDKMQQPRVIRQPLPDPPAAYDQAYLFRVVEALNLLMNQVTADAEWTAARLILTNTPRIPDDLPDTSTLPTGTVYLKQDSSGNFFLTIVKDTDV